MRYRICDAYLIASLCTTHAGTWVNVSFEANDGKGLVLGLLLVSEEGLSDFYYDNSQAKAVVSTIPQWNLFIVDLALAIPAALVSLT